MDFHSFGAKSRAKLDNCHPALTEIAELALRISPYDFTIIHGYRDEELQNALYNSGASTKQYPDSRHNKTDDPTYLHTEYFSDAIDFGPWIDGDVPWDDTHIFALIAGCFIAAAAHYGLTLRWGGDWDSDGSTTDQKLMDWGHVELVHV